jgi:hypothetical protein
MSKEDQALCERYQKNLETEIYEYFESVLSTETKKLKLV